MLNIYIYIQENNMLYETNEFIEMQRQENIYLALGWCCKLGCGDTLKGWNIIKNKIKYSDRYMPTFETVVEVLKRSGWK